MRNTGGSIGIALITTFLARSAQQHQAMMVTHLSTFDPVYQERVAQFQGAMTNATTTGNSPQMALGALYNNLLTQASLQAFVDNFRLYGFLCLACIPAVWLFRKALPMRGGMGGH